MPDLSRHQIESEHAANRRAMLAESTRQRGERDPLCHTLPSSGEHWTLGNAKEGSGDGATGTSTIGGPVRR
jgi:hypothetical protein